MPGRSSSVIFPSTIFTPSNRSLDISRFPSRSAQWANGDVEPLKAALKERVWQWGSMKEPAWLVESLCGGKFDPHHFTDYLKKKYTELYEL